MHACPAVCVGPGTRTRDGKPRCYREESSTHGRGSTVQECFKEYSFQDKVDALKNVVDHSNGKTVDQAASSRKDPRDSEAVRQCLKPDVRTPFGTVVWELRNTVMDNYWNKEVGKTRDQVPNLPVGMDPKSTCFGKRLSADATMADILNPEAAVEEESVHRMYRMTHNDYHPSEQISRNYNLPFDAKDCFGKKRAGKKDGMKERLVWTDDHSGEVMKRAVDLSIAYGKASVMEDYGAPKAICEYFANERELCLQRYLQHLNTLRLRFKARLPEIPFLDIYQDLIHLDKDCNGVLHEDSVYETLAKYKIFVDRALFSPLLELLKFREGSDVKYREMVDLLNWKCHVPATPKLSTTPLEHQHYNTTYRDEILAHGCKGDSIRAAGVPTCRWDLPFVPTPKGGNRCDREHLGDQTKACSLVSPSIFTRYGLSHIDLFKPREKEEIRSIFENSEVQFPGNSFEILWAEAMKTDGGEGVCVETFRKLVPRMKGIVEQKRG